MTAPFVAQAVVRSITNDSRPHHARGCLRKAWGASTAPLLRGGFRQSVLLCNGRLTVSLIR
jgi:hypothetical protein